MRRLTGAAVAAVLVLLAVGAGAARAGATGAPASPRSGTAVRNVLVISLPAISWEDLDLTRLPHLSALLAQSAVADMSVRGVRRVPSLADGYVTIGAGTRSLGHAGDDGECLEPGERFGPGTARDEMARRTGLPAASLASSAILCLAQHEVVGRNSSLLFDSQVSVLGDTLAAAHVQRAVIGNGDTTMSPSLDADYRRWAPLALTDRNGVVPAGAVGSSLLVRDPSAPFGIRLDEQRVLHAFDGVWHRAARSVVVVEASDLLRLQAYAPVTSSGVRSAMQAEVLRRVDSLVGDLLRRVDARHDAVLVVAPVQRPGPGRLTVAALRAPDVRAGLAESSWTRHSGIVSIVDVGPTILDQLGFAEPARMEGRPITFARTGGSFDSRVRWLVDTNRAAQFRDREIATVTVWFVVLQILLTGAALIAFVRFGRRSQIAIELAALTLLGFLPATFLAGLLPFYRWGSTPYWLFLFGVGFLIALVAWVTTDRGGVTTLIVALGAVVGLILVDVATGSRLQFDTVFGYTPTVAGRFAGLGNLGYSQLAAGAVLLAGLIAYRVRGRRGVWLAIALLAAAIVVDGAPFFGADVGGVLSMVPAYAVTATLLLGWRLRPRLVAIYGAAALALVGLFAAIDLSRPASKRTHLARLVSSGQGSGGTHSVATLLHRKLSENGDVLFGSTWTIMLPLVLAGIAYLIYRAPGRMRGLHERIPQLSAGLFGLLVVAVLGTTLNDSGIAIAGVMLGVVTPVLILVTMRGDRAVPRWSMAPVEELMPDEAETRPA